MKRVISLTIGAVAMVALSGCNLVPGTQGGVVKKVDIRDLYKGYGIAGDGTKGKSVAIEFCGNGYDYYRGGSHVDGGIFKIVNGTIQLSKVDMYPDNGGSYAIETDTGNFVRGDVYEVAGVETINPVDDIYKIPCP